jgi:membrane protein
VNGRLTGLVAFGVLLYGAISLMAVIESTFNKLYGSIKPRPWTRRIMLYWCVLTLGPLGIAASLVLGRTAYMTASSHVGAGFILSVTNVVSGFLVTWCLLLIMFRIVPDIRVSWRPALAGSFFAALAWEVGKWAFGIYVQMVAKNSVYGSLALLPLFMFWLYITWCVTLVGLEISYVMQFWPLLRRTFFFTRAGRNAGLSDLRWILSLGVLLHQRFKAGKPVDVEEAAEALMLPNDVTGELMMGLEKAGLVHATARGAYSLARPSDAITAHDLLTAARVMCHVPPDLAGEVSATVYPNAPALRELERIEAEWAKRHTLAELAGG